MLQRCGYGTLPYQFTCWGLTAPLVWPKIAFQCLMYQGAASRIAVPPNVSRPRQLRQPPRRTMASTRPNKNRGKVLFAYMPAPAATPASAATPTRAKRSDSSSPQTVTATRAAVGASSMKTWNTESIIGVAKANTAASAPAQLPNAALPAP